MIESILFIVFFNIIYIFYISNKSHLVSVRSELDGAYYSVQDTDKKIQTAFLLSSIKSDCIKLLDYIIEQSNVKPPLMVEDFKMARKKINYTNFREAEPYSKATSYSVNKGDELVLCVKSKITDKIHSKNIILYVAIHELAHIVCPEIGHTNLFNQIFSYLLRTAVELQIYKYHDYHLDNQEYCGITINQNILNKISTRVTNE